MPKLVKLPEHDDIVAEAKQQIASAQKLRRRLRRRSKRGDPTRNRRIHEQLALLGDAMKPIRSATGKLQWVFVDEAAAEELYTVSRRLQYERRQLRRML